MSLQPVGDEGPVARPRGTRVRAGNAMGRTRAGVLAGASASLARSGVKGTTMVAVATLGGVAKATVYNHFRTLDEVLAALVADRVDQLTRAALQADDAASGLASVVTAFREDPALRQVAVVEPAALVPLLRPVAGQPLWDVVRDSLQLLLGADPVRRETVLRWLLGQLVAPDAPDAVAAQASMLVGQIAT